MKKEDVTVRDIKWLLNWATKKWANAIMFIFVIFMALTSSVSWLLRDELKAKFSQWLITPEIEYNKIKEISEELRQSVGADAVIITLVDLARDKRKIISININGEMPNIIPDSGGTIFSPDEDINQIVVKLIRGERVCSNYNPLFSIVPRLKLTDGQYPARICHNAIPSGYSGHFLGILSVAFAEQPAAESYVLNELSIYSNKLVGYN